MRSLFLLLLLTSIAASAATRLVVTVVEQKTGRPVTSLQAADFSVVDDKTVRSIEAAEYQSEAIDVMLLLDASLLGEMVQPLVADFIEQLGPKEQMAVVAFHSSADLLQDFTSSKDLVRQAVSRVKYGNTPRLLDALYAAMEGGFENASYRRVILLLSAGVEGPSRVSIREVIKLARRNGVSIFPVYMMGHERSMLEDLARKTGGASFSIRDMRRAEERSPGRRVFDVLRSHYVLTLSGNLSLGDKARVDVKRPERLLVSFLPVE